MPGFLRAAKGGVELLVLVQPRASRTRIVGEHDGRLKIQIRGPPVDGAANDELFAFLADRLGIPRRDLALASGQRGRRKAVIARGVTLEAVARALEVGP